MKVDILIAHPGKHHVLHLVAGCIKSGATVAYAAPFYRCGIGRFVACLPGKIGSRAQGYFHPEIPLSVVVSPMKWQIRMLVSHFDNDTSYVQKFDRFVAQAIENGEFQARILVTLQDYMPESVRAAKRRGYLIWSDQISNQSAEVTSRIRRHWRELGLSSTWQHSERNNDEIIANANIITVPSSYCLDGIKERALSHTQVATIPYGAHAEQFSAERLEDPRQIVILARAPSIRKGGHLLLNALQQCGAELLAACMPKKIKVVILGKLETELLAILDKLALPEGLSVEHGGVPHVMVARLYQQASLFVMPALSESMSMACVEAMHAGLPLIITKYCGIDGFASGEMGYVVADTTESLAAVLVDAFNNQQLWQQWGANSKGIAKQLTWETYESGIAKLTRETLS